MGIKEMAKASHDRAIARAEFLVLVREKEGLLKLNEITEDVARSHWIDWGRDMFGDRLQQRVPTRSSMTRSSAQKQLDFYRWAAGKLFDIPMEDVTPKQRTEAKRIWCKAAYGHPDAAARWKKADFAELEMRAVAHAVSHPKSFGIIEAVDYDSQTGIKVTVRAHTDQDFYGLNIGDHVMIMDIETRDAAGNPMIMGGTATGRWSSSKPNWSECPRVYDGNLTDFNRQARAAMDLSADDLRKIVKNFIAPDGTMESRERQNFVMNRLADWHQKTSLEALDPTDRRPFLESLIQRLEMLGRPDLHERMVKCYSGMCPDGYSTTGRPRLTVAPQGFTRDFEDRDQVEVYHADSGEAVEGAIESNGRTYVVVRGQDGNEQTRIGPYRVRLKDA